MLSTRSQNMTQLPIGQRITFVHNQPYGLSAEILTGKVLEVSVSKRNGVEYFIQPDNMQRMGRWRKPHHIVSVLEMTSEQAA